MVTESLESKRYFIEILNLRVFRGNVRGNIKTLFFIDKSNEKYKYEDASSTFKIKGKTHQRVITISYVSKDKSELDVGSFTVKIGNDGTFCSGFWTGIVMEQIASKQTRWLKLDKATAINKNNFNLKNSSKEMIKSIENNSLNALSRFSGIGYRHFVSDLSRIHLSSIDFNTPETKAKIQSMLKDIQ